MHIDKSINGIRRGDYITAAAMVGINPDNARKALIRPGSKHHEKVKGALLKIQVSRNLLISKAEKI